MVNPQNYVKNFDKTTGYLDDGNVPSNAIDVYEATRFSECLPIPSFGIGLVL